MKSIPFKLKAVVESRSAATGQTAAPGDAVLIKRGEPRWLLLKCPCGCGEEIPINLDTRAGKAWRWYDHKAGGKVSVFPSVWRDTGCGSHFIIWRDSILLFGSADEDESFAPEYPGLRALADQLLKVWPDRGWVDYLGIADHLGEIPWDVLDACRHLVRAGLLVEGRGQQRAMFRRL